MERKEKLCILKVEAEELGLTSCCTSQGAPSTRDAVSLAAVPAARPSCTEAAKDLTVDSHFHTPPSSCYLLKTPKCTL